MMSHGLGSDEAQRILVYEFVTGGGFFTIPGKPVPDGSLRREGFAMVTAIGQDLASLAPDKLRVLHDARLPPLPLISAAQRLDVDSQESLLHFLEEPSDIAIVIAPEFSSHLVAACEQVRASTRLLINCSQAMLTWASSKQQTATRLHASGIPCPVGFRLCAEEQSCPSGLDFPLVVKPDDGAGSQAVRMIHDPTEWERLRPQPGERVESFMLGRPASVAALCGPDQIQWLSPFWQDMAVDDTAAEDRFAYQGGSRIDDPVMSERALSLVGRLDPLLEGACGYVGVDLVLGEADDGTEDVVIELNPRITSSYLGLSASCQTNFAEEMWRIATGERRSIVFADEPRSFRVDGTFSTSMS
jgi:predicted ATP-grasp superfamily ATP-dependent carboligase